jgi:hemerythrin-like domain-containing protein
MPDLTVNHLRRDHQEARKVLARLESLLDELDEDLRWTPEHCAIFGEVSEFLTGHLIRIIRKQDEILYPALEGLFPLHEGPLSVLRGEHEALSAHFREACRAGKLLCGGKDTEQNLHAFTKSGRKGLEILQDHLYKEERVLLAMVARYLTPERDAELLKKMQTLDAVGIPAAAPDAD